MKRQLIDDNPLDAVKFDRAILTHLLASPLYQTANVLFTYVSADNEVDTRRIIDHALSDGKAVCCPVVQGSGIMNARQIFAQSDLSPGFMGILEPNPNGPMVEPSHIDLVLVPCLGCDPFGSRIGYGGGYYDRYLKRVASDRQAAVDRNQSPHFIALCRENRLRMHLPHQPHDVPLSHCLTETGLFKCIELVAMQGR